MVKHLALAATFVTLAACNGGEAKHLGNCDACGGDCLIETFEITDRRHTTAPVEYDTRPPAGGPHDPCWVPWTIYDHAIPTERWVHNLEHGGVALLYDCPDGCDADIATLTAFVQAQPAGRTLLLPYAEMDSRFAAVAWGARLTSACVDTATLQQFFDGAVARAPENLTADPAGCPTP